MRLFCTLIDITPQALDDAKKIREKLNTSLEAFSYPGTFESIVVLFRIFLNVEIDIFLLEQERLPGFIIIKLRERPKFTRIVLLKSSSNTAFKINTYSKKALLLLNSSDKHYVSTFYSFIRTLVLAGISLEIEEPDIKVSKTDV